MTTAAWLIGTLGALAGGGAALRVLGVGGIAPELVANPLMPLNEPGWWAYRFAILALVAAGALLRWPRAGAVVLGSAGVGLFAALGPAAVSSVPLLSIAALLGLLVATRRPSATPTAGQPRYYADADIIRRIERRFVPPRT